MRICILQVNGNRVMYRGGDSLFKESRHEFVSIRHPNHIMMMNVRASWVGSRKHEIWQPLKCLGIASGDLPPPRIVIVEFTQLQSENRSLDAVHAAVPPYDGVMILPTLAVVEEHPHFPSELGVACRNRSRLPEGPQILTRIKTKAARIAETSRPLSLIESTVRLSCVFHDEEAVSFCKC